MSRIAPIVLRDVIPRSPIFTTAQAAAAASATPDTASRALGHLEARGLVTRLVRGLWADTRHPDFSPYAVVPFLLARSESHHETAASGYVSFLSALHLHGMLSQIPAAIHIAVGDQRPAVVTPVAVYRFHQLQPELLGGHAPGDVYGRFELATPSKALFDTLYLSARRGRQFSRLPEIEIPRGASDPEMRRWVDRIAYEPLRTAVANRWATLRERSTPRATNSHARVGSRARRR